VLFRSMLLPAFFALFGVVAALFLLGFGNADLHDDDMEHSDRNAGYAVEYGGDEAFIDDDEYVEYEVLWDEPEPEPEPLVQPEPVVHADDSQTEPLQSRPGHLLHAPAEPWHSEPVESWHSLLEDEAEEPSPEPPREAWRSILDELLSDVPPVKPKVQKAEPIGFAHNGFHVDEEQRFQPLPPPEPTRPSRHERAARHHQAEQSERRPFWFESNGRHSRDDPDDATSYGRHSAPGRD
jgi:hypothetical protein